MNTMWSVLRKELLDSWRDKRTWRAMILFPLIFTALLFVGLPALEKVQTAQLNRSLPVVGYIPTATKDEAVVFLRQSRRVLLYPVSGSQARNALLSEKVQVVVEPLSGFSRNVRAGGTGKISLLYDQASQSYSLAESMVVNLFSVYGQNVTVERLAAKGLPTTLAHPLELIAVDVSTLAQQGAVGLAEVLPYLLGIWAVAGGM